MAKKQAISVARLLHLCRVANVEIKHAFMVKKTKKRLFDEVSSCSVDTK